jgi:hypothetical protein
LHIICDVDGVLADFSKGFCGVLKDLYGLELDPRACKSWYWSDWADGLTKEMEDEAWKAIFEDPKYKAFWIDLSPLCSGQETLRINDLSRRNVVSFLTNRAAKGQHKNVAEDTRWWLEGQSLRTAANTFLADHGDKGKQARKLGAHLAIEDNGPNALDYLDNGIGVALLRRAYNESFVELVKARGGFIVDTLAEFLDMCFKFDAQQDQEPVYEPATT